MQSGSKEEELQEELFMPCLLRLLGVEEFLVVEALLIVTDTENPANIGLGKHMSPSDEPTKSAVWHAP